MILVPCIAYYIPMPTTEFGFYCPYDFTTVNRDMHGNVGFRWHTFEIVIS
jgi:hypothetical protein